MRAAPPGLPPSRREPAVARTTRVRPRGDGRRPSPGHGTATSRPAPSLRPATQPMLGDMVKFLVVAIVAASAFVIYALIDCLFAESSRFRALNKPLWAVIIVVLPVIGAVLWLLLGKNRPAAARLRVASSPPTTTPSSPAGRAAPSPTSTGRRPTNASDGSSKSSPTSTTTTRPAPPDPEGDSGLTPAVVPTGDSSGSPATDYAVALLASLVDAGVREVVVSPGSRSQAVALAAAEFERAGRAPAARADRRARGGLPRARARRRDRRPRRRRHHLRHRRREPAPRRARGAPLGRAHGRADGRPARRAARHRRQPDHACSRASSVAACPVVHDLEAPRSGVGRRRGRPRRLARAAVAAALGRPDADGERARSPGPVQLNVAFREPLSAAVEPLPAARPEPRSTAPPRRCRPVAAVARRGRRRARHGRRRRPRRPGPRPRQLARQLGAPLVAEVSSGAHFGPNLALGFRTLLGEPELGGAVRRVVVLGHPTLSRQVPALLTRAGRRGRRRARRRRRAVRPGPRRPRSSTPSRSRARRRRRRPRPPRLGRALGARRPPAVVGDDDGRARPRRRHERRRPPSAPSSSAGEVDLLRRPVTRRALAEALWRVTWPHDRLVLGASRLIREVDEVVPGQGDPRARQPGPRGHRRHGRDGHRHRPREPASTTARPGVTRVLVGDLTLLHDVGSLLFGEGEVRPRLQVVVGNDGGGTIFDGLEVAATAPADAMRRVQFTPHARPARARSPRLRLDHVRAARRAPSSTRRSPGRPTAPCSIEVPLAR